MRRRIGILVVVQLALMVALRFAWQAEDRAYHATLVDAAERARKGSVEIDGRWYSMTELQLSAMTTFTGPESPRSSQVRPQFGDPVAAITDFSERLAERGIELWVLPVPARPLVAPRSPTWLMSSDTPFDRFVGDLRDRNVEVVDLLPPLQRRAWLRPKRWVHVSDSHWTSDTVVLTAQIIADRIRSRAWADALPAVETEARWRRVNRPAAQGALVDAQVPKTAPVRVRSVLQGGEPVPRDVPESPVVVIGDSHVHWYNEYDGDIGRQLTHELGTPVDVLSVAGGGGSISREELVRRDWMRPGYLDNKRVVVWVFWTVGIYDEEWRIVRLDPMPPTRLEAPARALREASDAFMIADGTNLVGLNYRWRRAEGDGVFWLRKPEAAPVQFVGDPRGDFIFEAKSREASRVKLWMAGVELAVVDVPAGSSPRYRVAIPAGLTRAEPNDLFFEMLGIGGQPPKRDVFGLIRLLRTEAENLFSEDFATIPEGATGMSAAPAHVKISAVALAREATMSLTLSAPPASAILRIRVRNTGARGQQLSVHVNRGPATDLVIERGRWIEHTFRVEGLVPGDNVIMLRSKLANNQGRALELDVLEIDAPSESP